LCLPAKHHEGEEEADRRDVGRRPGCRSEPAPERGQGQRAPRPPGRRQGGVGYRTGREAEERSEGHLTMSILVIAEHEGSTLKPSTLSAVAAAKEIAGHAGGDLHILVVGKGMDGAAEAAAKIPGVAKVLKADADAYDHLLAENV